MLCGTRLSCAADLSSVNEASQTCMLHWSRDVVRLCKCQVTAVWCRQEMQAEVEALQTASQLRQQFQQWNKEVPWTMHVPGPDMAHV